MKPLLETIIDQNLMDAMTPKLKAQIDELLAEGHPHGRIMMVLDTITRGKRPAAVRAAEVYLRGLEKTGVA